MSTRHVKILVTLAMSMMLFVAQAQAALQTFDNKAAFLTATSANSASGPLPDLGIQTPEQATVGSVTFSVAPGGDNFFIGANNVTGLPSTDWYPPTPGNDIALGHENLQVQTAQPVFALGFDFVEPNVTVQPWGGRPVDSTFEVVLYAGQTEVDRFTFNAPDDVAAFVGVWSDTAFDRVTIIDVTNDANDIDDEYFGEFYSSAIALPCVDQVCTTNNPAAFLAATQAQSITGQDENGNPLPYPNLGAVHGAATIGTVTLRGPQVFVGTQGAQVTNNDWTTLLPGPEIALAGNGAAKRLTLQFAQPVNAVGFEYVEPQLGPNVGRKFSEATFTMTLRSGTTIVGQTTFNGANDAVTFVGVWSPLAFDVVELHAIAFGPKLISTMFAGELNLGIVRPSGTIYVVSTIGGIANRGMLFSVSPRSGNRQIVNDFGNGRQGQPGQSPEGVAVEASGYVLVVDLGAGTNKRGALFRVNPLSRTRRILSDFGNGGTGPLGVDPAGVAVESTGAILVTDQFAGTNSRGALFRVNRVTGQRSVLVDFGAGQPQEYAPLDIAVQTSGNILVVAGGGRTANRGALVSVNPNTGSRTVVSEFGDSAKGPILPYVEGLAIEASGQILITGYELSSRELLLLRVDPTSGSRSLVSRFRDSLQGTVGTPVNGVAVEANGNILITGREDSGRLALLQVNPISGFRTLRSDFADPAQGPLGGTLIGVAVQK